MSTVNSASTSAAKKDVTDFTGRLHGLDAIRYVCAAWVVLSHIDTPFRELHDPGLPIKIASSVYRWSISGPAAVIVFFVTSGLCIHFNYRTGGSIDYFSYYIRRYLRIGLPLIAALGMILLVSHKGAYSLSIVSLNDSVLWSLIAELIYYTLYPALMFAKRRLGWTALLFIAYAAAYAVVFSHPRLALEGHYPAFGWKLNWILGLPCWLLGCLLAERLPANTSSSDFVGERGDRNDSLWQWRAGVWIASGITIFLQFHQHSQRFHFGYSFTLDFFAILVFFWLRREIAYYQTHEPLAWLEKAGAGSYSLYLIHPILLGLLGGTQQFLGNGPLHWTVLLCEVIAASAVFYFLVEKPSHLLARMFRPKFKQPAI